MNKKAFIFPIILSSLLLGACSSILPKKKEEKDPFFVKLNNEKGINLAISDKASFANPASYLSVKNIDQFQEYTYSMLPSDDILDNEEIPYDYGKNIVNTGTTVLSYFKYTFYIKNIGDTTARYDLKINLENKNSNDGTNRSLADVLRVMVYYSEYKEGQEVEHLKEVYAKRSDNWNYDMNGLKTDREFISVHPNDNKEDEEHPLAASFMSDSLVATYAQAHFTKNDMKRCTIVYWLEGEDPQSTVEDVPAAASINLDVEINAFEQD